MSLYNDVSNQQQLEYKIVKKELIPNDSLEISNVNGCKKKRSRKNYTADQINHLVTEYKKNKYVTKRERIELSRKTGIPDHKITVWFQNHRIYEKKRLQKNEQHKQNQYNQTVGGDVTSSYSYNQSMGNMTIDYESIENIFPSPEFGYNYETVENISSPYSQYSTTNYPTIENTPAYLGYDVPSNYDIQSSFSSPQTQSVQFSQVTSTLSSPPPYYSNSHQYQITTPNDPLVGNSYNTTNNEYELCNYDDKNFYIL